jgi:hypothetical protein
MSEIDRTRQQEILHSLAQRLRAKAEAEMRKVNDELAEERTRRHRLIDAELACATTIWVTG